MFDFEIAQYLYRVYYLLTYFYDSNYKARAYYKAALAVDGYGKAIQSLYSSNSLKDLPNIGNSIEKNIIEILETGHLKLIDELLNGRPYTVFDFFEHTSLTKITLEKIFANNIFSLSDIKSIKDLGENISSNERLKILADVQHYANGVQYQYAHVLELANELISELETTASIKKMSITGDLRLALDRIKHGEIICSSNLDGIELAQKIKSMSRFDVIRIEKDCIFVKRFSILFKIWLVDDQEFFYNLAVTTGDSACVEEIIVNGMGKNLLLSSEEKVFKAVGIDYISPRLRLSFLEKLQNKARSPITLYGDLHMHTNWSDGLHSIEQMRAMAKILGYKYIAITDHSQSLKPFGMSELDALTQIKKIRDLNIDSEIKILSGIEVDIKADGTLDYPDEILKEFDLVIAAIHSHFNLSPMEMLNRIEKALHNPYVDIFAHPTGRLLGRPGKISVGRDEIWIDFNTILRICKEHNVALEINCFPERFDLNLEKVIQAINYGVKVSIGSDSHSMYHMDSTKYALDMLRDLKVSAESVLNFRSFSELNEFIARKKGYSPKIGTVLESKFKNYDFYFNNNFSLSSGNDKVIGIDLTGSEEKASGFAVLAGKKVLTELVLSDNDIISKVLSINPAIVSIDSPLTLPAGRCCGDKHCECASHGIMRYCELTLKRFGIGVYPCLIDSMVNLTLRGIRMANLLRQSGIKVIESYPGVAQDLLHIPRKRKGLELLIKGLTNFGIENISNNISHDEADAITSALVGCFYLNNLYVGIGNEIEDYLIVPRLNSELFPNRVVLGLTGKISSGKTTISEYLRFKYGFKYLRYSKVIEELYNVKGRDDLQRIGLEISKDVQKQKALTIKMIEMMDNTSSYIIDGIRQNEDYDTLSNTFKDRFILLSIDAKLNKRFERYKKQHHGILKIDEFTKIDEHAVETSIIGLSQHANYYINNNSSYKALFEQIDSVICSIARR